MTEPKQLSWMDIAFCSKGIKTFSARFYRIENEKRPSLILAFVRARTFLPQRKLTHYPEMKPQEQLGEEFNRRAGAGRGEEMAPDP